MNAKKIITLSGAVLLALTSTSLAADWGYHHNGNHKPGFGPPGAGNGQLQYVYTTVNVGPYNPPACSWFGINNSGELVGNTGWPGPAPAGTTPPEIVVATILDKGKLTTWAATLPDGSTSGWSECMGINDHGVAVGDYLDDANPQLAHDFIRTRDGHMTLLSPVEPGAFFLYENIGINNEGTIAGTFTLDADYWTDWGNGDYASLAAQGFIFKDGKYTTWTYPGATGTWFDSINDNGTIGGEWTDAAGNGYPFLLNKDGSTTTIVTPASFSPAVPANQWVAGLNNNDEVVVIYLANDVTTAATVWRGYLLSRGNYTQIYLPNDVGDTQPESINDEGVIAGTYGYAEYGFVATPVHDHDHH